MRINGLLPNRLSDEIQIAVKVLFGNSPLKLGDQKIQAGGGSHLAGFNVKVSLPD